MIGREVVGDDLAAIAALLREDVIREVDESDMRPEAYAAVGDA